MNSSTKTPVPQWQLGSGNSKDKDKDHEKDHRNKSHAHHSSNGTHSANDMNSRSSSNKKHHKSHANSSNNNNNNNNNNNSSSSMEELDSEDEMIMMGEDLNPSNVYYRNLQNGDDVVNEIATQLQNSTPVLRSRKQVRARTLSSAGSMTTADEVSDREDEDELVERERNLLQDKEQNFVWSVITLVLVFIYKVVTTVLFAPFWIPLRLLFGIKLKTVPFMAVPMRRRKQTAAVTVFMLLVPLVGVAYGSAMLLLLFPLTTLPMAAYWMWVLYFDNAPETGSRFPFLRYWPGWKHFVDYFPMSLIKTADLNPKGKYVFSYHPHGIISLGAFGCFTSDAAGFSTLFPGIDLRVLTLAQNLIVPWLREFLLSMGVGSCSRKACDQILQRGPGSAILLVVGGAEESLESRPGTYRLVLGRKGFVRVALKNHAELVPVIAFGENNAFETTVGDKKSMFRRIQVWLQKKMGFAIPIFRGRGIFNYTFGILPFRTPIIVVVGKPVKFDFDSIPTFLLENNGEKLATTEEGRALVDKYHNKYISALKKLFDEHKNKWAIRRSESLYIVR